jgi:peptidoglycan/xylan/chitin deacetylase (PgdA/CDA1 family)
LTIADERFFLEERYMRRPASARLLPLFYRLKRAIPRRVQMGLRRSIAKRQRRRHESGGRFPHWPIEPLLVDQLGGGPVDAWPGGHRFAYVLTHDVEGPRGLANIGRLLEIERAHGMVSAWFFVADDYEVGEPVLRAIRAAGGEIGLHGLHHDGQLFQSRRHFERQLPRIHRHLREWGAEGFRSPSTHRNAAWMPELGASYDSSFPDTHPFDAQPGGCCSILPYFLGDLVEVPITLPQDHTLFELLREADIALWRKKAAWIAQHGGLVTVLVHPDYALTADRLRHYDELLAFLAGLDGGWHALPRDVARWWRRRAGLEAAIETKEGAYA